MNSGKQVTYTTYYGAMAIIGAVLLAFGIGLNAFEASAGLGKTLYDLPWFIGIIGVALLIALNYMIINTVVDILYGIIDPRVRCS